MNGIEESFDVEFAVFACGIRAYLDETARKLFGIEGIPAQSVAVVEIEFGVDLLHTGIQKHILAVKNDDRVYHALQILDLMGADDYSGIISGVLEHSGAELGLGRDVQTVGRLVHKDVGSAAGKREGDVGLFELTCGHLVHFHSFVHFEVFHSRRKVFKFEVWPERSEALRPGDCSTWDWGNLIREVEHLREEFRIPGVRVYAVTVYTSALCFFQSAD